MDKGKGKNIIQKKNNEIFPTFFYIYLGSLSKR